MATMLPTVCSTCLSLNRISQPIKLIDKTLLSFYNINVPNNAVICWECDRLFKKIHIFLRQAAKAQRHLATQMSQLMFTKSAPSLSNLKLVRLSKISIEPEVKTYSSCKNLPRLPRLLPKPVLQSESLSKSSQQFVFNEGCTSKETSVAMIASNMVGEFEFVKTEDVKIDVKEEIHDDPMDSVDDFEQILDDINKESTITIQMRGNQMTVKNDFNTNITSPKSHIPVVPTKTSFIPPQTANVAPKIVTPNKSVVDPNDALLKVIQMRGNQMIVKNEVNNTNITSSKPHIPVVPTKTLYILPQTANVVPKIVTTLKSVVDPNDALQKVLQVMRRGGSNKKLKENQFYLIAKEATILHRQLLDIRENYRKSDHFQIAKFKCDKCLETFINQQEFDKHTVLHSVEESGKIICEICNQCFQTDQEMVTHNKCHYKCHVCTVCGLQTSTRQAMWRHFHNFHQIVGLACELCGWMCWTSSQRDGHKFRDHDVKFTCDECGVECISKHRLTAHKKSGHFRARSPSNTVECEECHRPYYKRQRWYHNKIYHRKTEETSYCTICKKFLKYSHYMNHMSSMHTGTKGHLQCPQCPSKLCSENRLKLHLLKVHGQGKFVCDHCNEEFNTRRKIYVHLRKHSERKYRPTSICDICGKVLNLGPRHLQEHRNSHLGLRPHVCQHCGDTFSHSAALYTHTKLKHKDKAPAKRP